MTDDVNTPLPAYSGRDPYVFVSYSHRNKSGVYAEIRRIQDMGFNVWYDDGINSGDIWSDALADAIAGCSQVVYFVTPESAESEYCQREIMFAQHRKVAVTAVHLTPTELPHGMQLILGHRQAILKHQVSAEKYANALQQALEAPQETTSAFEITASQAPANDPRQSILILPFVNRSSNQDADFFCEGIADEIITALSSVSELRVISGSAARQVDAKQASLKELQELLGVDYVLEGSVQSAGDRLRITARLPDTDSGEVLWADRWDGGNDQIFDMQDSISHGVLDALKIELGEAQSAQLALHPIEDVHAYEYLLRARHAIHQWTPEALRQALDYLQRGEDIVGDNAYIISARGYIHWMFHNLGLEPSPKHLESAQRCVSRLFELDRKSPEAFRLQGLVQVMRKGAMADAVVNLRKSLASNPNDNDALFWLSQVYGIVGRVSSGSVLAERLLKIDPISPLNHGLPAALAMMDGDTDKAARLFSELHDNDPDNAIFSLLFGQALMMNRQWDQGLKVFQDLADAAPDAFFGRVSAFLAACLEHKPDRAATIADTAFIAAAEADPQTSWTIAQGYALLGEDDEAIDWLENAVALGFWNYPLIAERDAVLQGLREHERFEALMPTLRDKWIFLDA